MAAKLPSSCCTTGFKFEGTPTGKVITIGDDVDCYISGPSTPSKNAVILIPDILGIHQTNIQLLVDSFATELETTVLMPDLYNKDPVASMDANLMAWMKGPPGHSPELTEPPILAAIKYAKDELKAAKLGSIGYCLGAKYSARLGAHFAATYTAHPSFVSLDELARTAGPISIAAAADDELCPPEMRAKSEALLKGLTIAAGGGGAGDGGGAPLPFQICVYSGVSHGFACRGDMGDAHQRFCIERAFAQGVTWLARWLD